MRGGVANDPGAGHHRRRDRRGWWAVAQGAFHGVVSAAAAELIAPLLPSGGTGLVGVLETGIAEFVGGRGTQVTLNVVAGQSGRQSGGRALREPVRRCGADDAAGG